MKTAPAIVVLIAMAASHAALASDHCHQPMSQWQSRAAVTAHVQQLGIQADRLKIDDGCYEVRGRDSDGNRIELKLDPATLDPLELEVQFRPGANTARYLPAAR